jgi:CheY-like chemotaxis protein
MSHEIRTPLNGVLGMAQALALEPLSTSQHAKVQTIREAGGTLLVLLNDILDLSEIEAGELRLETSPFDLEQMIKTTCAIFAETAQSKGLKVYFTSQEETRGLWEGDASGCRKILSNLLSNAVKFTTKGEVRVELERTEIGAARLSISDTGMGIDADELPKLFSKFYQVDASTTRQFGGSGLGLSICQGLTEMMGGTITVESVLGDGSKFTVELPLSFRGPSHANGAVAKCADLTNSDGDPERAAEVELDRELDRVDAPNTLRILAADDNPTNQLILTALLQSLDVSVVVVENGRLAVEAWDGGAFDLILMDIQMPEMDGVDAARRIRALETEKEHAGMDGFAAKPIQLEKLCQAIDNALSV